MEQTFSKMKNIPSKLGACAHEALPEAMEECSPGLLLVMAPDGLTVAVSRSRINACEYHSENQKRPGPRIRSALAASTKAINT
jgi:hypothetical protein